jgi:transcriptional regulator with XRE-family HTH domain
MATPRPTPPTFGGRLAQQRERAGLTQKALGLKLGVTHSTVSKWESDENDPPIKTLRQMRDVLGVSVDWLVAGTDAAPPSLVNVKKIRRAMRTLMDVADALDRVGAAVGELEGALPPEPEE